MVQQHFCGSQIWCGRTQIKSNKQATRMRMMAHQRCDERAIDEKMKMLSCSRYLCSLLLLLLALIVGSANGARADISALDTASSYAHLKPSRMSHRECTRTALNAVTNTKSYTGIKARPSLYTVLSLARGGSAPGSVPDSSLPIRVAYQGEPGAYSEKSTRELLGDNVIAVGRPSFEACFRAVASMECDYACLPIENSLGGSIHENYDLMLRYDLTIIAEHEFRVKHCLLAKTGVKRDDIKYAISHRKCLGLHWVCEHAYMSVCCIDCLSQTLPCPVSPCLAP
jgi:Prephenate dehydratase